MNVRHLVEDGRLTIAGWCLLLAALTFGLYWFLGPRDTPFSYQVSQANNILHGHLDMDPRYTRNIDILERVLFDGEGFCLPPGDEDKLANTPGAEISEDCRIYMQHSFGPALLLVPAVTIFGQDVNQTLVSVIFASLTAPLVFLVAAHLTHRTRARVWLTVLFMFGTIFFWAGSNGGIWMLNHTVATFFAFAAIYFTLVRSKPFVAAVLLGAAFMSRPTLAMTGLFFVIMFSHLWMRPAEDGQSFMRRIDLRPLLRFAAGVAPFVLATMFINWARFGTPLESGYNYGEQVHQRSLAWVYRYGTFDLRYIVDHPRIILEKMPIFQREGPWILPSWAGMAIWVTTPPFLYSMFAGVRHRAVVTIGAVALAAAAAVIMARGIGRAWDAAWATAEIPYGIHLLPFWAMIGVAVFFALRNRDRLIAACWAAIIPTALFVFTFAATGWAQFGYRYALDFTPFLWLLAVRAIGDEIRWHHKLLIGIGVAVNLMGVLWIYAFAPAQLNDWTWVRF
jgi:hypothetical protein